MPLQFDKILPSSHVLLVPETFSRRSICRSIFGNLSGYGQAPLPKNLKLERLF